MKGAMQSQQCILEFLNPDHLRLFVNVTVCLNGVERLPHCGLGRLVCNHDHRDWISGLRAGGYPSNTEAEKEGWLASKAREFREHWADEMDGAAMYRALADRADGEQREIFLELAGPEEQVEADFHDA